MALFMVEGLPATGSEQAAIRQVLADLSRAVRSRAGDLIEAQVASDLSRLFVIVEAETEEVVRQAAAAARLAIRLVKPVRLVGQTLAEVKASRGAVDYVVEWNFPPGLTMEAYLQRKAANSPKYALVPEVKFLRTYVCEDMTKCLCFYDAETVEAVLKARQVVEAPVDAVTRVSPVA